MAQKKWGKAPVINVIRKKKEHPEEPHGSAWKIAYADFMTAMMAFFLVMWLVSSMSPSQKKGIANYFDPMGSAVGASGVGGVLGGLSLATDGALAYRSADTAINPPLGADIIDQEGAGPHSKEGEQEEALVNEKHATPSQENQALEEVKEKLQQAIEQHPELQGVTKMIQVSLKEEGLQIDLIENYEKPMFHLGRSVLTPDAKKLLDVVSQAVDLLPNKLTITGHTDGLPYVGQRFTNWELSTERALATRQYLSHSAPHLQVDAVVGKASTDPYLPKNPTSSLNRRVTLLLMRQFPEEGLKKSRGPHTEHRAMEVRDEERDAKQPRLLPDQAPSQEGAERPKGGVME